MREIHPRSIITNRTTIIRAGRGWRRSRLSMMMILTMMSLTWRSRKSCPRHININIIATTAKTVTMIMKTRRCLSSWSLRRSMSDFQVAKDLVTKTGSWSISIRQAARWIWPTSTAVRTPLTIKYTAGRTKWWARCTPRGPSPTPLHSRISAACPTNPWSKRSTPRKSTLWVAPHPKNPYSNNTQVYNRLDLRQGRPTSIWMQSSRL